VVALDQTPLLFYFVDGVGLLVRRRQRLRVLELRQLVHVADAPYHVVLPELWLWRLLLLRLLARARGRRRASLH